MEGYVSWWCHLIGVQDIYAIQIATGIVAGGSALFLTFAIFALAMQILNSIISVSSR